MVSRLLLALLLPLALVLLATWALELRRGRLPAWLERPSRRQALLWNTLWGLLLALSLLRWLLSR